MWAAMIRPKMTLAASGPSPMCTIRSSVHSNATGDAATRGGRTFCEGVSAMPNAENSLSP